MKRLKMKVLETEWARGAISVAVVVVFAYAFLQNPSDEMMRGAIIAALTQVTSYWLGSSKGSDDKTKMLAEEQEPRRVVVENKADEPVPTADVGEGELPPEQRL